MHIRQYNKQTDHNAVRSCLIELQDFERDFDPRMPTGAEIVDEYIPQMFDRCEKSLGTVLVMEIDGTVVGFATVLAKVVSDELEDGGIEYGLVSDLVVNQNFRGKGLGRSLLDAAETYARSKRVKSLRIGVLAANAAAHALYKSAGFSNLYTELEKDLGNL